MKASKIKIKIKVKKRFYRNIGLTLLLLFAFYICYKTYQTQHSKCNRKFREGLTSDELKGISKEYRQCNKNCKGEIKACREKCGRDKECKEDECGSDLKEGCSEECLDKCYETCPVDKDECDDPKDCEGTDDQKKVCKKKANDCRKATTKCQDICKLEDDGPSAPSGGDKGGGKGKGMGF